VNKKKFKNVLVVLGGISGERAVSLDSGRACIDALKKKNIMFQLLTQNLRI
jgi:D-alanine-D-alanine ligase-like ATP-grasp enzyme